MNGQNIQLDKGSKIQFKIRNYRYIKSGIFRQSSLLDIKRYSREGGLLEWMMSMMENISSLD